jgi:acyl-CoA thioesterase II
MNGSPQPYAQATAQPALDLAMAVTPSGVLRDTFVGPGRDYGMFRVYGGHLLGQGLAAAFATVSTAMHAHSLHAYFLKTGAALEPIGYQVSRLRDGRNYATREVRAVQDDHTLMIMLASFKVDEPGEHHQPAMPAVPDGAAVAARRRRRGMGPLPLPFAVGHGVELQPLDEWSPMSPTGAEPAIRLWMRAAASAAADRRARQCMLAYLSDGSMMFNALRPHGQPFASHRATSLDHAVWFHDDADPADWLLFDQRGPVAADARGFNQGRIFSGDGRLVASITQESMMRRL